MASDQLMIYDKPTNASIIQRIKGIDYEEQDLIKVNQLMDDF